MQTADADLTRRIKSRALSAGFDLVGIASAERSQYASYLRGWLDSGRAGTMQWMHRRFEERIDIKRYFPDAASIICVALNYHAPLADESEEGAPAPQDGARIARYTLGDDYHEIISSRLHQLADWIRGQIPEARTCCGVDTAPVLEREFAARAGIGWMGKNTCLINARLGSWLFLGQIITNLNLASDEPVTDHCGSCMRCIEACPTQAITEPYSLDASRCISYLNIEHRGGIPPALAARMDDWLIGCDICQEVCPHNRQPPAAIHPSLQARFPAGALSAAAVVQWTSEHYQAELRGSAMKRVKLPQLQRNAEIVLRNRAARQDRRPAGDPIER